MLKLVSGMFSLSDKIIKVLDFLSLRNNLIAGNIANVDTPGYKSVDIKFEDQLEAMLKTEDEVQMAATDARHIRSDLLKMDRLGPEIVFEPTMEMRMDGNNVDIDEEMVNLAENQIMYSALVQSIAEELNGLKYTIEEGRRG